MRIILGFLLLVICTAVTAKNYSELYENLPVKLSGQVDKQHINQLAEKLFHEFTGLDDRLGVFCTNDKRLTDQSYEWYCQISPLDAEVLDNGLTRPYPPDANQWTMRINLKNNTYELKRDWVSQ
ncbi:MAG: hypothetical protein ACSHWU_12365 [Marinicella sp.]